MIVHPAMHAYQRQALQFSLDHLESYQAMDLGLGKTLVALQWIKNIEARGVLVVAPIKVMYNTWPNEIKKWTPELTYTILHGPEKGRRLKERVKIYLINYEGLLWLYTELSKTKIIPFNAIILDEGTKIKAHNTKRFKALKAMRVLFNKGKMILSGTPAPNSLLNLWSQYFFLDGGVRLDTAYTRFQATYFYPLDPQGRVWNIKPGAASLIYDRIKDITFRLDATDYITLPNRVDNFIKLNLPPAVLQKYKQLEKDFFLQLSENTALEIFNSAAMSIKLRQFVQGGVYIDDKHNYEIVHTEKLEALKELMEVNEGTPILCAIQFIFELDMIKKVYPNAPVIRGRTPPAETTEIVKAWNKGQIPLLLCHPACISHGMNMQYGSNILLWLGLPWSGEIYEQLIGRLKRQGQAKDHVIVNHVIIRDTIDVAVAASLKARAKGQKALLDFIKQYHEGGLEEP